ncbi:MAG TPA: hypothetical protein VMT89_12850 [Candidatus Acidoferrales bacterium]|nr:hypothetical protein [Candidatus Acidoferrales bacterium]
MGDFAMARTPTSKTGAQSTERQLAGFIDKYTPKVAATACAALAKMRAMLPGAVELVYDNYNGLAIAFGPSERTSEAIFSITLYPRWVSLFFTQGASLDDPYKLLQGDGKTMRHIVLDAASTLDNPAVKSLLKQALAGASKPIDRGNPSRIVIKSISAKQRPRRPQ